MSNSVYKELSNLLIKDPSAAYEIDLDQLQTILSYSELFPVDVYIKISNILELRKNPPKPEQKIKVKVKVPINPIKVKIPVKVKPQPVQLKLKPIIPVQGVRKVKINKPIIPSNLPDTAEDMVKALNTNYHLAADMTDQQLESLLRWSDKMYYVPEETDQVEQVELLDDKVYDYIKRMYNERKPDRRGTMKSLSSSTGVGAKPIKERSVTLPLFMGSLDNLFRGTGEVNKWSLKKPGPYHISAKMDGTSALYIDGQLFTRGDALTGRDISHVIPYLNLPDVNYTVRGEIVMKKSLFNQKYKGKKSGTTGAVRKVNRGCVSGSLSSINHIDYEFLSDLDFVAYEVIIDETCQLVPSQQFKMLEQDGFQVAYHYLTDEISDDSLSKQYDWLLSNYDYHVDGLVVHVNQVYNRCSDKNPDYAQSFKDPLPEDTAITRIIDIEWNPTQYGYLMPTVVYEPVVIHDVKLQRATAHTARDVKIKGLGPGAEIEVIYWGMVNPRINRVIKPVKPKFPDVDYEWISNEQGEEVNIKLSDSALNQLEEDNPIHTVRIKKIHQFLIKIGAKGLGETTVGKIYWNNPKMRTVGSFLNLKEESVAFLGPTNKKKITQSIQDALNKINIPVLMAASKVFGRGLGETKFTKVFEQFPDFIIERHDYHKYVEIFKQVEGFATKTAELAASGMDAFWEFVDTEVPDEVMIKIIDNTTSSLNDSQQVPNANSQISGKNICITGFRDSNISDFITRNGGKVQNSCTGTTNMLIRSSSVYTNKKTETAESKGIPIISKEEFIMKYMS